RGWFQLSLLPSLGVMGRPPFRTLLTHGFMVDKDGKKLSKSAGAALKDLFDRYGVDVLRWWVSSLAYENDVKVDEEFFKLAGESYRKIRNTLRFMLSNLSDYTFDASADFSDFHTHSIDSWVLGEYNTLITNVAEAYNTYAFHEAQKLIYRFCNTTLSSEYLSAVKDRLYCDAPDSERRRNTQRTLATITDGLCKLLAPIMCHTADEAYRALHKIEPKDTSACVHLTGFPDHAKLESATGWPKLWEAIEQVMKAAEDTRAKSDIDNPLDLGVKLPDPDGTFDWFNTEDLADICGVSRFVLTKDSSIEITDLRNEPRCDRSWKRDTTVKERSDGGTLSDRDAQALGL
ncbi:MAG: class I tRNA ligase family protein, partial [Phycisphaerales bacterium]